MRAVRDWRSDEGGTILGGVVPLLLASQRTAEKGGDVDDDLFSETSHALMQLAIHMGMMSTVFATSGDQYAPAHDGWKAFLRETRDWANRKTEEVHDFAEAFD